MENTAYDLLAHTELKSGAVRAQTQCQTEDASFFCKIGGNFDFYG